MRNVVKVRIYPTPQQQIGLSKSFGCARWWWNYALHLNNEMYKATGKGLSRQGYNDRLPKLKQEFPWLTECYSQVLQFDDGKPEPEANREGKAVGIDVGLTHFAVTSDGSKFSNPKPLRKHERNLKRKQRKLSRKQKGSKRRTKARRIVARVHERIANTRKDFHHKLSRKLVNENQVIIVENLAVKNLMKNHNLAKAISDFGWAEFTRQLKYKAEKDGKIYLEIDRFFPSSKTCHVCLNQVGSLPLDVRSWECSNCKTQHDRDVNAAISIRDEGLRILALGTSATAQGGNVRPKRGRKSSVEAVAVELGELRPLVGGVVHIGTSVHPKTRNVLTKLLAKLLAKLSLEMQEWAVNRTRRGCLSARQWNNQGIN